MTHYHFSAVFNKPEPMWLSTDPEFRCVELDWIKFNPGDLTWSGWYMGEFDEFPTTEMVGGKHPLMATKVGYSLTGTDENFLGQSAKFNLFCMMQIIGQPVSAELTGLLVKEAIRVAQRDWYCKLASAASEVLEESQYRQRWHGNIPTL